MPLRSCCVPSCSSKKGGNTPLYSFPRDRTLQKLWLSYIAPLRSDFSSLRPDQIRKKLICQRHFESRFFRGDVRVHQSCPTLFTNEEILMGIPQRPVHFVPHPDHTYVNMHGDHTYAMSFFSAPSTLSAGHSPISSALEPQTPPRHDNVTDFSAPSTSSVVHAPSTSALEPHTSLRNANINAFSAPSTSSAVHVPNTSTLEAQTPPRNANVPETILRHRMIGKFVELTPKCKNLYKRCVKIRKSLQKQKISFSERLKKAENMANETSFKSVVEDMGSTLKTFIEMQSKLKGIKKYGRRFTMDEKMLALALMKNSPKGYKFLSKIFVLPNKRTLNRVTEKFSFDCGLSEKLFKALKDNVKNFSPTKKICSIVFDEVQLTPHLTYRESNDKIIGFVDDGEAKRSLRYADHALVFMIRGVAASWRQPIAYYLCEGTTPTTSLMAIIKNVVAATVTCGLEPVALICDQGATNQRALKNLQQATRREQLLTGQELDETINLSGKKLSVVYDPPHLIKGVRNNFLTKNMIFDGKEAKWQDIIDVYNMDNGIGDLRMLPKINDEHVIPAKIRKMKVSNCSKALSESVAGMLAYTSKFDRHVNGEKISATMQNTSDAVLFFDQLFDSVNASKGTVVTGKMRTPVMEKSRHHEFWPAALKKLNSIQFKDCYSAAAKRKGGPIYKKVPSIVNWITTIQSFQRIWKLLQGLGVYKFYSRHLNQDPLENFFGKIRSINYRNVNPDPDTFATAFKSILINDLIGLHSSGANCEEDVGASIINLRALFLRDEQSSRQCEEQDPGVSIGTSRLQPSTSSLCLSRISPDLNLLKNQAMREKIRIHATAYVTGYVCKKLLKKHKCKNCKNTFLSRVSSIHEWISHKEYRLLKGRNLKYPSDNIVVLLGELIDIINSHLNSNPHQINLKKTIKKQYFHMFKPDRLGCIDHHDIVNDYFITLVCRMQIHNWCNGINKIFKGKVIEKLSKTLTLPQQMAYSKYIMFNRKRQNKA